MKLIKVIDENGKSYSSTYVKRAKGLVKHDRAYWVDDSTICLRMPQNTLEVKMLKASDFERMIALTVAGNYALRNKNNLGHYAVKALCDTYDGIIDELEKANIEISPGLEKIGFDNIPEPKDQRKLYDLEQCVYAKNCLLNPILKIEKTKVENQSDPTVINIKKDSKTSNNSNNHNIIINVGEVKNDDIEDLLEEQQELLEDLETAQEELDELNSDLEDSSQSLTEEKNNLEELVNEAEEIKTDIQEIEDEISFLSSNKLDDDDEERLEDLEDELSIKEDELSEINEDIEDSKREIINLQSEIEEIKEDIEELKNEIQSIKEEISENEEKINKLK